MKNLIKQIILENLNESDPKVGTGKKPKNSSRRLYTDENPNDTVSVKFRTKEDIVDTLNKESFKSKSHKRQSQIINLIHQRVRAAYQNAKDPDTKKRLKRALDYITLRKEKSKQKTIRLQKESVENNIVTCDNCGWQWNLKDGGNDPYICHKCGHDNTPKNKLKEQEDYKGSHTAPSKDQGYSSMDRLTDIYPDDIYSSKALQYYGEGYPYDRIALTIMQGAKDKPNKPIKIYRAVPDFNYELKQKIKDLLKINQYYDKFNFFPINNIIVNNLQDKYSIENYSYEKQTQLILSDISKQINELKNQLKNNKITINSGDWVTTTFQYAKEHGEAHLNNKFKVLSKIVPAHTLYTDGNSIHEWGYNP